MYSRQKLRVPKAFAKAERKLETWLSLDRSVSAKFTLVGIVNFFRSDIQSCHVIPPQNRLKQCLKTVLSL